jgi:hypothetical protein
MTTSAANIPLWLMLLKQTLIHHNIYESRVIDCCAGDTSMVYYLMEHFETVGAADFNSVTESICNTEEQWKLLASMNSGVVTRPPKDSAFIKSMVESAFGREEVKFFAALVQYPYNSILALQNPSIIIDIAGIDESFFIWINLNSGQYQPPKLYSITKCIANKSFTIERRRNDQRYFGMKPPPRKETDLQLSTVLDQTIRAKNYASQFPETRFMSRRKAENYVQSAMSGTTRRAKRYYLNSNKIF